MGVGIQLVTPVLPEEERIEGVLRPVGYKILVQIMSPDADTHERLIQLPPEQRDREWGAQPWAKVIELGPDAYKDEKRYPNGAWCQPGDCVLIRPYVGTRFKVGGGLYALINDDTVEGLTTEPGSIERG